MEGEDRHAPAPRMTALSVSKRNQRGSVPRPRGEAVTTVVLLGRMFLSPVASAHLGAMWRGAGTGRDRGTGCQLRTIRGAVHLRVTWFRSHVRRKAQRLRACPRGHPTSEWGRLIRRKLASTSRWPTHLSLASATLSKGLVTVEFLLSPRVAL